MPIDFLPSFPVALAIVLCGAAPAVLLALSHGPWRIAGPGRRFLLAAILVWSAWLASMAATASGWVDALTGGLLLASVTLAGFTLWTLIAWGFTLSMLLALDGAGRAMTVEDWALAHTRGRSLGAFTRDRLGLLVALGLVEIQGHHVVMTDRRGRVCARVSAGLRRLFGIRR